jgi:hypothetical protein
MNIIFGREQAELMQDKYTILELDTFRIGGQTVAAFCAVEGIPIMELPNVSSMKNLHENLLVEYKKQNWSYCNQAIEHLHGFWGREVDTFYESLTERIRHYSENCPGDAWDGIIIKN